MILNMNYKIRKKKKKINQKLLVLQLILKAIAKILDKYCDIVLVGDSMANVLIRIN